MELKILSTDILIIGGGAAGCYGALTIAENSNSSVIVLEKANIKRSGCLAAGVNALNAYIVKGKTPEDYVEYARWDADEIVRDDLLLSMAEGLNEATHKLEELGLVILKDENGEYIARGNRNIKINGENIKTILSDSIKDKENIKIMNHVNVIDYIVKDNEIKGAYGVSVNKEELYLINAKAVICATGGASGIYKPNNPGFSRHKMWYSPFNTGAGYAMGIRAGAEMTTFEMRFIALRCKDTIAPTGTIAQGIKAEQINSKGEEYGSKYGNRTSERLYGTVKESIEGRGPCYLKTSGISKQEEEDLVKAYFNMAPSQSLRWIESGRGPSIQDTEIEGTEPYIVGGHTASGYWIDNSRETTIKGLFAAGDVAGGCPQKYVTGSLVEGEIAALSAIRHIGNKENEEFSVESSKRILNEIESLIGETQGLYSIQDLEEAMQKVMDCYAGGISSNYGYNEKSLSIATIKIDEIIKLTKNLKAKDSRELLSLFELKDRLIISKVLIAHLNARKETRWHSFGENLDYPDKDIKYLKYINSKTIDGEIKIINRDIVKRGEIYEHKN